MQIESTDMAIRRVRALLSIARTTLQAAQYQRAAQAAAQQRHTPDSGDTRYQYAVLQQQEAARQTQQAYAQQAYMEQANAARAAEYERMQAQVATARKHLAAATTASLALDITGAGITATKSYVDGLARRGTGSKVTPERAHALTERVRQLNQNTIRPDAASRAYEQRQQAAQHHRHADHLAHTTDTVRHQQLS